MASTNIPVLVSNQFVYSSAVNRLLQLAANMYDATTNNTYVMGNNYPSVFRPLFSRDANPSGMGTNVFISGYTNVIFVEPHPIQTTVNSPYRSTLRICPPWSIRCPLINYPTNVYGVPWIIGAKKGFPNFNELAMENAFQLTRKLQVTRASTNASVAPITTYAYNQMYPPEPHQPVGRGMLEFIHQHIHQHHSSR